MTLLEELERKGVALEPKLSFKSTAPLEAETLTLLQAHKADLLKALTASGSLPRLPWQLESLLRAAGSGALPTGTVLCTGGTCYRPEHLHLGLGLRLPHGRP